jgi:Fe-S-cluster containining protein
MRWLKGPELIDFMCKTLRRTHMDMALTQAVCTRVFQTKADPVPPAGSDQEKICIETGMEEFNCQCCGRCCLTLDYRDQLTTEDVQRWRQIGRTDVINRIGVFLKEGHGPRYRMWVSPHTKEYEKHCPFLKKESSSQRYLCRIHDVKPAICRQYPVSRKHAQMTGCKGFNAINT